MEKVTNNERKYRMSSIDIDKFSEYFSQFDINNQIKGDDPLFKEIKKYEYGSAEYNKIRNEIMIKSSSLIYFFLKDFYYSYASSTYNIEDVIQESFLILDRCIKSYEASKGAYSTYVYNSLKKTIATSVGLANTPINTAKKFHSRDFEMLKDMLRGVDKKTIISNYQIYQRKNEEDAEKAFNMLIPFTMVTYSTEELDDIMQMDEFDVYEGDYSLMSLFYKHKETEALFEDGWEKKILSDCLDEEFELFLSTISEHDAQILKYYFGYGTDYLTQQEIAKIFNCSYQAISQCINKNIKKFVVKLHYHGGIDDYEKILTL